MAEKLTVLIPCKNEAWNIRPCIESARDTADEVVAANLRLLNRRACGG